MVESNSKLFVLLISRVNEIVLLIDGLIIDAAIARSIKVPIRYRISMKKLILSVT